MVILVESYFNRSSRHSLTNTEGDTEISYCKSWNSYGFSIVTLSGQRRQSWWLREHGGFGYRKKPCSWLTITFSIKLLRIFWKLTQPYSNGLQKPTLVHKKFLEILPYDMIRYDTYLLTAIGLKTGGSITAHICTKTIHRTTQWNIILIIEHI